MLSDASAYIITQLEEELNTLPGLKNEITQHLIELGYITLQKANALRNLDIAQAKTNFLHEVRQSTLFPKAYIEKLMPAGRDFTISTLLRQLCDIDEGLTIDSLPPKGETTLSSRLIHYRLDLFGLWPMTVAISFSRLSIQKLRELAEFAKCTDLEAINHLADAESFTKHLLEIHPAEKFILIFKSPNVSEKTRKSLDKRHAFKRQLIEDFGEKTPFFRTLSDEVLKNKSTKIDYHFLQKETLDPFKKFVLRLIQVHQWQDGFYEGLLDSNMGDVTLKSMIDTINFYNDTDKHNIKTHRAITYIDQGYFVFNSLFFLQEYMAEDKISTTKNKDQLVLENISSQLETTDEKGQKDFTTNIKQLKNEIYADNQKEPNERKGFLQRIYFGVKRVMKKAFRFASKIFSWVKDKVEKMWGFLKTLFRNLFENLQLGIRAFVDGINFLFGRKAICSNSESEHIVSKFSFDGDSVSISTRQIHTVLENHLESLGYNIKSMKFTLSIVSGILKLIMNMVNIITWPLLIINIIKIYRNVSASFHELKTNSNL